MKKKNNVEQNRNWNRTFETWENHLSTKDIPFIITVQTNFGSDDQKRNRVKQINLLRIITYPRLSHQCSGSGFKLNLCHFLVCDYSHNN